MTKIDRWISKGLLLIANFYAVYTNYAYHFTQFQTSLLLMAQLGVDVIAFAIYATKQEVE